MQIFFQKYKINHLNISLVNNNIRLDGTDLSLGFNANIKIMPIRLNKWSRKIKNEECI